MPRLSVVSVACILRTSTKPSAVAKADSSGTSTIITIRPLVGRIITSTPEKPSSTALQRRQPTCSPSIGALSAVTSKGTVNSTA